MRLWCGVVVIAGSLGLMAGGCDRRKPTASTLPVRAHRPYEPLPVPPETDPSKLLFRALVHRDAPAVRKILGEHPELLNKQINGTYPLSLACESRSLPLVQAMVERGADLKVRTVDGSSMLWAAVNSDSLPIAKYLIEKGADPKVLEADGETLLWAAQTKEMVDFLIAAGVDPKQRDKSGDMAIHAACRKSRKEVIERFLDLGISIEEKGNWGMPPLHFAVTTATGDPRSVVRMLLQRGANINSRGWNNNTVIHECIFYNRVEMLELLLTRGAEATAKDAQDQTPMDLAVVAGERDRKKAIDLLRAHGATKKGEEVPTVK
jgi:ankyrin repeat protein